MIPLVFAVACARCGEVPSNLHPLLPPYVSFVDLGTVLGHSSDIHDPVRCLIVNSLFS